METTDNIICHEKFILQNYFSTMSIERKRKAEKQYTKISIEDCRIMGDFIYLFVCVFFMFCRMYKNNF